MILTQRTRSNDHFTLSGGRNASGGLFPPRRKPIFITFEATYWHASALYSWALGIWFQQASYFYLEQPPCTMNKRAFKGKYSADFERHIC